MKKILFLLGIIVLMSCSNSSQEHQEESESFVIHTHEIEEKLDAKIQRVELSLISDDVWLEEDSLPSFEYDFPGIKNLKICNKTTLFEFIMDWAQYLYFEEEYEISKNNYNITYMMEIQSRYAIMKYNNDSIWTIYKLPNYVHW